MVCRVFLCSEHAKGEVDPVADPRTHRRYKKLRSEFAAECKAADVPCWICAQPIDYTADTGDERNRSAFELDHYYPVSERPDLALDPANFRASHAGCNRARGNGVARAGLGRLSRDWLTPVGQ